MKPRTTNVDTLKRVQIARTSLLLDEPFFGMLALQLAIVEDSTRETAWTNGTTIGFNPSFVDSLSDDELKALIAHEVMHCACGHPWRRSGREQQTWNEACDYAINHVISEAGFVLPGGALIDSQYAGKSAEWIYDRLPPKQNDDSGGTGGTGYGDVVDAPSDGQADKGQNNDDDSGTQPSASQQSGDQQMTEADWQQAVSQALKAGKAPASLSRAVRELTAPIVDWRSTLRKYMQDAARSDYSWERPNVRYIAHGLYLPSLRSIECGPIAIAVDTSGSIDDVLLAQFASEMQSIADELQPRSIDVLYCDSHVHRVDRFERGEPITLSAVGGGGTAFAPVFDRIAADGEPIVVCVYLTDLEGSFPAVPPDYSVIWCVSGRATAAPFGDVVPCNR